MIKLKANIQYLYDVDCVSLGAWVIFCQRWLFKLNQHFWGASIENPCKGLSSINAFKRSFPCLISGTKFDQQSPELQSNLKFWVQCQWLQISFSSLKKRREISGLLQFKWVYFSKLSAFCYKTRSLVLRCTEDFKYLDIWIILCINRTRCSEFGPSKSDKNEL